LSILVEQLAKNLNLRQIEIHFRRQQAGGGIREKTKRTGNIEVLRGNFRIQQCSQNRDSTQNAGG